MAIGRPAHVPRLQSRRTAAAIAVAMLVALASMLGCAPRVTPFSIQAPIWRDPDRRPFAGELKAAFAPKRWDAIEKSVLRPVTNLLEVPSPAEAVNVNSLDEVPDSSWFENRVGLTAFSPEDAARGPCEGDPIDTTGPWTLKSSKPDGADPGFVITTSDGRRYLIKLDDNIQRARTSAADVVASRIYHAAGFNVPCNAVVTFRREVIQIADGARTETSSGDKIPFTAQHLDSILTRVTPQPDGTYRGMASSYLPGRPLGPWKYAGIRRDDRNDVVPHQDRRELRASRMLAAWTDHSDQHDQNTLAMWIDTGGGRGFVRHNLLDFGDCFGSLWEGSVQQAWRREHSYWLDPSEVLADFVTFGAIERPWDRAELGPTGLVFGYYTDRGFEPESWRPTYPNPAFQRMTELDAAWMARIMAQMAEAHIAAMLSTARLDRALHDELLRILLARRVAILRRYFARVSPLSRGGIETRSGEPWLCLRDLAVEAAIANRHRRYSARARLISGQAARPATAVETQRPGQPCVHIANLGLQTPSGGYWVLAVHVQDEVVTGPDRQRSPTPLSVHLFAREHDAQIVGIERRE